MGSSGTPLPVAASIEMGSNQSSVRSWQGSDLTAYWSLPISFFYWTRFIWKQCTVRHYHSDLSDQN